MELGAWVALATVFALGAMSPGPSLAVVLRNTMAGGRSQGVATGLGHGLGFGLYAFTAALGIATALAANDSVGLVLKWGGTAILLWLGVTFLRHAAAGPNSQDIDDNHGPSDTAGFVQGFSIAILNPKILAWMLALYAPFGRNGSAGNVHRRSLVRHSRYFTNNRGQSPTSEGESAHH